MTAAFVDFVRLRPTNSTNARSAGVTAAIAPAAVAAAIAPAALRALPTKPNWRGEPVPYPAGLIAATIGTVTAPQLLNAGVSLLGLIDDLGDPTARGLRGHAAAALTGTPTTGHLKATGTAALALATTRDPLHATVITLATHVFNVLDLRPGRATKVFVAVLIATRAAPQGTYAGPLLVLGAYDLRERAMLGDTGSTLLGAVAGQHLTATLDRQTLRLAATAMALLAATAEFTSLTAAIDRVPPLRALDWLGRRNPNA
jgi:UDP-GlcNAc:undecaprenyl-phosphate/decaprenyl-phosphate GlcNAc-1-phosphate transferase